MSKCSLKKIASVKQAVAPTKIRPVKFKFLQVDTV